MMSANLRAFLALLRICEVGTANEEGYCKIVGGSTFGNWDDHPRIVKSGTFSNGKAWTSSAAGGYQFLASSWDDCKSALNLPDFSPASQDEAAIFLIRRANALHAVEDGDLRNALHLCNKTWASLPGSPYGQPTRTYEDCERIYLSAGGQLSQAGGATQPAPPPAPTEPAPTFGEQVMALPAILVAAASSLLPLVIDLFRAKGTKTTERNADIVEAVAPTLIEIAKQLVPGANEQSATEAILSNKSLQEQFRAQVALQWKDVEPFLNFEEESRGKARDFAEQMTGTGPTWRQVGAGVLLAVLSLVIVGGSGWIFYQVLFAADSTFSPSTRDGIVEVLKNILVLVVGFFFGSSASGRQAGETVSQIAKGK